MNLTPELRAIAASLADAIPLEDLAVARAGVAPPPTVVTPVGLRSIVPAHVEGVKCGLPASNDGELTAEDLDAIDAAVHTDKKRNRYDSHREESAWQAERRDDDVWRGTT